MKDFILTALGAMAIFTTVLTIAFLMASAPHLAEAYGVWAGVVAVVTALTAASLMVATLVHWIFR